MTIEEQFQEQQDRLREAENLLQAALQDIPHGRPLALLILEFLEDRP